jgi:hypothetical protein
VRPQRAEKVFQHFARISLWPPPASPRGRACGAAAAGRTAAPLVRAKISRFRRACGGLHLVDLTDRQRLGGQRAGPERAASSRSPAWVRAMIRLRPSCSSKLG